MPPACPVFGVRGRNTARLRNFGARFLCVSAGAAQRVEQLTSELPSLEFKDYETALAGFVQSEIVNAKLSCSRHSNCVRQF